MFFLPNQTLLIFLLSIDSRSHSHRDCAGWGSRPQASLFSNTQNSKTPHSKLGSVEQSYILLHSTKHLKCKCIFLLIFHLNLVVHFLQWYWTVVRNLSEGVRKCFGCRKEPKYLGFLLLCYPFHHNVHFLFSLSSLHNFALVLCAVLVGTLAGRQVRHPACEFVPYCCSLWACGMQLLQIIVQRSLRTHALESL